VLGSDEPKPDRMMEMGLNQHSKLRVIECEGEQAEQVKEQMVKIPILQALVLYL
jgi:hypothetical protein